MKKTICLMLSVLLTLSLSGCANNDTPKEKAALYKAGTVTGTAQGMDGPVSVEVTFDDTKILTIQIVEENETAGICEWVYETLPDQIITNQSLAVDTVSGATVTSNAVLNAVADAVEQAGGSAAALKEKPVVSAAEDAEHETDVVVVRTDGGLGCIVDRRTGYFNRKNRCDWRDKYYGFRYFCLC